MKRYIFSSLPARLALPLALLALAGCATGPDPRDPYERWNRKVANFNENVDAVVLKPVATGYREAVPALVRTGVNNFFGNLSDGWSMVNNVLQLKFQYAGESWLRVGVNTLWGFGGILDIATDLGIERHREDFGQTLGRWGVPTGPYVVLPLLGPSTVRDATVLPIDYRGDPIRLAPTEAETGLYVLRAVDTRSNLLRASSVLDQAALDKYRFTRDAYLQRRRAQIFEGRESDADEGGDNEDYTKGEEGGATGQPAREPAPPAR